MSTAPRTHHRSHFRANLRWAFGWTLWMATFFSAIVLVQSIVRGSTWFESYHQSAWAVIVGYYVAALVAGVAVGGLGVVAYDQGAPTWQGSGSLPKRKIIAYGAALLIALFLLWLDLR